eukprot:12990469-Alexandrium_andersonii.AAC.1
MHTSSTYSNALTWLSNTCAGTHSTKYSLHCTAACKSACTPCHSRCTEEDEVEQHEDAPTDMLLTR